MESLTESNSHSELFQAPEHDYSQLYLPLPEKGSGSDSADRFIGSMLTFGSIDQITGIPIHKALESDLAMIKSLDRNQIKPFVDNHATSVTADVVNSQIQLLSDLYAKTGDPKAFDAAKKEQEEAKIITKQPLSNELVTIALARMQQKGLNQIDKKFVARQANFAQIAEYLEYAGIGIGDFLGAIVPGRNSYQFATHPELSDFRDQIKNFRNLMPEGQVKAFPQILQDMWKASGENPLIFQDRALSFLNRDDIRKVNEAFAMDIVDVATILPFSKFARFARLRSTPLKFARDAGRPDIAGKMVADALEDTSGKAAESAGTDRISAAASALPFGGEGAIPEITDGLSSDAAHLISERLSKSREYQDKLLYDGNALIQRSPLRTREIEQAQTKFVAQQVGKVVIKDSTPISFRAEVEITNPGYKPGNPAEFFTKIKDREADVENIQSRMAELRDTYGSAVHGEKGANPAANEYKMLQEQLYDSNQEIKKLNESWRKATEVDPTKIVTKTVLYKFDDVGALEAVEYSNATGALNSADTYINQMERGLVEESTSINFTQAQMRTMLERGFTNAARGLSRGSKKNVSDILLQGDRDKIGRYSTLDLFQGIQTPEGLLRLKTAEEVAAYHGARDTLDTVYLLKNRQLRRELEFNNWKAVNIKNEEGDVISFVKPDIKLNRVPSDVKKLYDMEVGRPVEITDLNKINARIQEEGWQLMRSKYPMEFGDELIEYVLAKPSHIKPLPQRVLAFRPGYVPRVYKNIFYVAERTSPKIINGLERLGYKSVARYFDSLTEAKRWASTRVSEGIEIRTGREWLESKPEYKEDYEAAVFGGLYSGKRSDTVIPFGFQGTEAEHIGAFAAVEKAMSHVSTRVPMNEFRMGMIHRFLNSARNPITHESYLANPGDWLSDIRTDKLSQTNKEYQALNNMRDWMKDQFRIPTTNERNWHNFGVRLANILDGKNLNRTPVNKLRLGLMNLAQKDLFGVMRAAAFHSLLGWFNPAQMYVQAMGASMAFSLHPAIAGKIIPQYVALRAAMFTDHPGAWRAAGRAAGASESAFEQLVREFRKTGIRDSVRSSADFDAAIHGYGVTAGALRRASDAGLIFFREGETFVRSYGWLLARHEFLKLKPKGYKLTDADLDAVTSRSLALTLNLNRANRAHWQKGIFSIPTQFLQITAKFVESMAYSLKGGAGKWTKGEKAKIMAGQAALFGAAGVPFSKWAIANLSEYMKSEGDYGLGIKDQDVIRAVNGGFLEMMLYDWTGEDISLSSRVSIPEGIENFVEMLMDSDRTASDKLTGAFGEVPHRIYQVAHHLGPILAGYSEKDTFEPSFFVEAMAEIGDITSGWRNYHKARMWEQAKALLDSKGEPILPLDPEEDGALILAQKWGLTPRAIEEYYDLSKFNRLSKQDIDHSAQAWVEIARRYTNSPYMGTERGQRRAKAMISFILKDLTEEQKAVVAEKVSNKLKENNYKIAKELAEAIDNLMLSHGDSSRQSIFGSKGNAELNPLMLPETNSNAN